MGGLVERSGSITIEYPDLMISSSQSASRLTISLNNISINAHISIDIDTMIGETPDSSKAQILMHRHVENLSIGKMSGSVTIYAHN